MAETETLEIKPQEGPQTAFLATPADIAVYGGSAGGGKSWALLLEAMRHTGNPHFGAVLFRRTSPQITNEGGLWDEAGKLYPLARASPRVGDLDWIFPSGACVGFRHLQHEATKYDWQGSQVPLLGFDELTHFSESQFFYLLSRNRSMCGVRPYVRATCNPDASSWVKKFLAPWVDRVWQVKNPRLAARSGEIRWFIRHEGKIVWGVTREELVDRFGPETLPKSVTFVRASVYDNKALLAKDPGYLANLKALPDVERERLLNGNWDVKNDGLVYPEFGSCVIEPELWPAKLGRWNEGGIDWGFNNPFGALAAFLDRDDVLWVGWERHGSRITLTEHSKALPRGEIRWWADPAGADQIAEMQAAGHQVVPCVHLGSQADAGPLKSGLAVVTDRIRNGRMKVRGDLGHLIDEAGKYHYDGATEKPVDRDNHLLAALRYMVVGIDRFRSVKDADPEPTAEEKAAIAEAAKAAEEAAVAEHYDPENSRWWA